MLEKPGFQDTSPEPGTETDVFPGGFSGRIQGTRLDQRITGSSLSQNRNATALSLSLSTGQSAFPSFRVPGAIFSFGEMKESDLFLQDSPNQTLLQNQLSAVDVPSFFFSIPKIGLSVDCSGRAKQVQVLLHGGRLLGPL